MSQEDKILKNLKTNSTKNFYNNNLKNENKLQPLNK